MKTISAAELAELAPYGEIVATLRHAFQSHYTTPVRHHHETSDASTLLLMPAWSEDWIGLKTVVVKTDNAALGLPTVQASYLLIEARTGKTVALMDGTELTRRRTAAASALAADYLARKDASRMVLVGAGALGAHFVRAHAAVRAISHVSIFNRSVEKAETLARELTASGLKASAVEDLEASVRQADIISCVTTSTKPILKGAWLKRGAHVDLAGAFKPAMRETDGEVVARSRVYVDTRDGAEAEAGDLLQARDEGKFDFAQVRGDLFDLCRGEAGGRKSETEITLFKSCGTALEDLATAIMVYQKAA
ncbi:MAG TPA: ornithine cyclodeaminase family protein [Aestuariivirga sp.]|nr:ornithine cyclodeaminase family protein [Aestuariivirga sp.]